MSTYKRTMSSAVTTTVGGTGPDAVYSAIEATVDPPP
jgi:hypothetical protein